MNASPICRPPLHTSQRPLPPTGFDAPGFLRRTTRRLAVSMLLLAPLVHLGGCAESDKTDSDSPHVAAVRLRSADPAMMTPGGTEPGNVAHGKELSLRYGPKLGSYHLAMTIRSTLPKGIPLKSTGSFDFEWRPAGDVFAFQMSAMKVSLKSRGVDFQLDATTDRLFLKENGRVELDIRRGEAEPDEVSPESFFDKPLFTAEFSDTGPSQLQVNADHFLTEAGFDKTGALGIFCFPWFPSSPVKHGVEWTVSRLVPLGGDVAEDVPIDFVYSAESTRQCGQDTCAVLRFRGDTGRQLVALEGRKVTAQYIFEGTTLFAIDAGRIVSSNFVLDMTVVDRGIEIPSHGVYDLVFRD